MKKIRLFLIPILLTVSMCSVAQFRISPYLTTGYMNHLGRNGINTEIGVDFEIVKRLDVAFSARYSSLDNNMENEVTINALSSFVSFVIVNREQHRLMLGPGVSYGRYKRFTETIGFEKEYKSFWFNPVKIRYDYNINQNLRAGLDVSLYGEDGDGSMYFGLVFGYVL